MRRLFVALLLLLANSGKLYAQDIREIYVNLYTDSLKKGTYNYINIDGELANGKYLPLDTNYLIFQSSYGKFYGNNLYIEKDCSVTKVDITLTFKRDPAIKKEFSVWIKTRPDIAVLPTNQEILDGIKNNRKKKNR